MLVVVRRKNDNLTRLFYGWKKGLKGYRDIRKYIVEEVSPSVLVLEENEMTRSVVAYILGQYPENITVFRAEKLSFLELIKTSST